MIEMMWGKGGSGLKEWQPSCAYFHGFLNKSRDVVDKAALGKVFPRLLRRSASMSFSLGVRV